MKPHTKVYLKYFGFKIAEDCFCEICGIYANDIHHIEARGMGGNPLKDKDQIQNLMALCRTCHNRYGDIRDKKEWLKSLHLKFIELRKKSR